ncbi:MAG: O-antigen ligase [Calothrix sp. MO_192.B10]|nr:O-antigen ligase [Calothrix sp. MO_192.B10]
MGIKVGKYFIFFELVFTVLSLIHYIADWLPLIVSGGASEGDGFDFASVNLTANVLLYLLTYICAIFFLLFRWEKAVYYISKNKIIWLILAVAIASLIWSYNREAAIKSCIQLIGTTIFGLYFGTRYSIKDQVKILGFVYILILVLSTIFIVALPKYGIMGAVHAGAIRGIFTHKNFFGQALALSAILIFMLTMISPKRKFILYMGLGLVIVLLLLARSTTSMVNTLVLFFALFLYRTFRLRYMFMVPTFILLITLGLISYFIYIENSQVLFSAIGKDATLTGRTDIWAFAWDMIQKRFWLGYGLGSFWNGLDGPSAYVVRAVRWPVPYAHNAWLELWLEFGLIGLLTYVIGFVINICRSIWLARVTLGTDGLWPLIYLTYIVMSTITEGRLVGENNILWVLYTALSISIFIPPEKSQKYPSRLIAEVKPSYKY